jgi:hypothetical protein
VDNKKGGGLGGWLLFEDGLGPWRRMSVCFLVVVFSLLPLKRDSVTRFFASGFFHESPSSKPLKITLGSFRIFSKILGDIRKSRCTTGVNDTGGKFATCVNDTGGELPPVSTTPAANLPPVSTKPAANFVTSSACVVDTGGK